VAAQVAAQVVDQAVVRPCGLEALERLQCGFGGGEHVQGHTPTVIRVHDVHAATGPAHVHGASSAIDSVRHGAEGVRFVSGMQEALDGAVAVQHAVDDLAPLRRVPARQSRVVERVLHQFVQVQLPEHAAGDGKLHPSAGPAFLVVSVISPQSNLTAMEFMSCLAEEAARDLQAICNKEDLAHMDADAVIRTAAALNAAIEQSAQVRTDIIAEVAAEVMDGSAAAVADPAVVKGLPGVVSRTLLRMEKRLFKHDHGILGLFEWTRRLLATAEIRSDAQRVRLACVAMEASLRLACSAPDDLGEHVVPVQAHACQLVQDGVRLLRGANTAIADRGETLEADAQAALRDVFSGGCDGQALAAVALRDFRLPLLGELCTRWDAGFEAVLTPVQTSAVCTSVLSSGAVARIVRRLKESTSAGGLLVIAGLLRELGPAVLQSAPGLTSMLQFPLCWAMMAGDGSSLAVQSAVASVLRQLASLDAGALSPDDVAKVVTACCSRALARQGAALRAFPGACVDVLGDVINSFVRTCEKASAPPTAAVAKVCAALEDAAALKVVRGRPIPEATVWMTACVDACRRVSAVATC
jgi:hypothetical protein